MSLNYEIRGDGANAILFLHGFGVSSRLWVSQMEHFSPDYTVISVDLPGHGESEFVPLNLDELAKEIHHILDELRIDTVTLMGSSFGGMISLKIYEHRPGRIMRMVWVGALPRFAKDEGYPAGLDLGRIRKLSDQFEGDYESILDVFFRSLFSRKDRDNIRFKFIKQFRKETKLPEREALRHFLNIIEKDDLRDLMAKVICPVLLINGTQDYICPPAVVDWIEKAFIDVRRVDFEKAGHFPFLIYPQEFNQAVENFI